MCGNANMMEAFPGIILNDETYLLQAGEFRLFYFGGGIMADSSITKRALASALKELLEETSFKRISVADICERCDMNRKSFYYHFRDKYDLIIWIFDTETAAILQKRRVNDRWDVVELICHYLYRNRNFYYKAFQIQGQNSLSEHFRELLLPPLQERMAEVIGPGDVHQIGANFFADGIVCAILRWLLDKDCIPPEQFISIIRKVVESTALIVYEDISKDAQ